MRGAYFEALGITLKRGRYFTEQDVATAEPVAIINETMARTFWKDADPLASPSPVAIPPTTAPGCASSESSVT